MEKEERLLVSENEDYIELKDISKINNNLLLNISSNYIVKHIFSYLKYNYILKLIKYNKLIQNKIGFDKQNYKNYSNTKYIKGEIFQWWKKWDWYYSFICIYWFNLDNILYSL